MVSSWKREVIKNFNDNTETYGLHSGIQETVAQNLALYFPDLDSPDVLEIGAGTGALTQHLLRKYKQGHFKITDISPKMIALAQGRLKQENAIFSVLDGENIEFSQCFDLIAANMVFQWFEDIETSIFRLRKYLKPGGTLYFTIPGPFCFQEWKAVLKKLLLPSGMHTFKTPCGIFREEYRIVKYQNALSFLETLKKTGVDTPKRGYRPLENSQIIRACRLFDEMFEGQMTWHILYGCLRA